MEERQEILMNDSSDEYFSDGKSLLEKMAYCPVNMEDESQEVKRYYINPEEISETFDKVMSDE